MSNSVIPAAVRAVHDKIAAALPAALVLVGPGGTEDPGTNGMVLVGCSDADEETYAEAVTGSQHWAQLGGKSRDEQFTVHCVAVSWNGNGEALTAMDGAFTLLGAIESAIVADPTLGGVLLYAVGISAVGLKFATDTKGAAAHVPFDVECRTRI